MTLTVKPVLCITDKLTPSCDMSFLVVWQSAADGLLLSFHRLRRRPGALLERGTHRPTERRAHRAGKLQLLDDRPRRRLAALPWSRSRSCAWTPTTVAAGAARVTSGTLIEQRQRRHPARGRRSAARRPHGRVFPAERPLRRNRVARRPGLGALRQGQAAGRAPRPDAARRRRPDDLP